MVKFAPAEPLLAFFVMVTANMINYAERTAGDSGLCMRSLRTV